MSFVVEIPVRFADVDHAGIVYYPRYFHYFHVAFEELWRQRIGARAYQQLLDVDRIGFPAVKAECQFHAPLRFGDTARIELTIPKLGARSITFGYRIANDETLVAEGFVVTATVDLARFVAVPVPERVVVILADLVISS